ncbi:type I-E CRISPR-associated protein Cas5/CasD [Arsenicicoccus cauae]|uniref:type I-E CRISPR-associated protein Cas5/CasD n=1 Tax=Arsenicicoccus cauae TaxID=2663847 RepID=UPI00370D265F
MSTLLLRLAAPLQAWGDSSKFASRGTRREPTKSGVLGLLAAADGRRRTDAIEDLVGLRFGCRIDQPGRVMRDYHTSTRWQRGESQAHSLSERYYLADAVFLAGVEGDRDLLDRIVSVLREPTFPLYLGRRSCPVVGEVVLDLVDEELEAALRAAPWQAARWYRASLGQNVSLELALDEASASQDARAQGVIETVRDLPTSFDPERRGYTWRRVVRAWEDKSNPDGRQRPDFLAALGGAL